MEIESPEWGDILADAATASGLVATPQRIEACRNLALMLADWNRVHNVTAVVDPRDVAVRHFADSLHAAGALPPRGRVMDLGSGAGFPGLVVKIFLPDLSVTLVEAKRKKVSFHRAAIAGLGLTDIVSVHARSEDLEGQPGYADVFGSVVTRAVADLSRLWAYSGPFLASGGFLLAMKAKAAAGEVEDLKKRLSGLEIRETPYELPGGLKRTLIRVEKMRAAGDRAAGEKD